MAYLYGVHPALEALKAQVGLKRLLVAQGAGGAAERVARQAQEQGLPVQRLPRQQLDRLSGKGAHQGVVLEVEDYRHAGLEEVIARMQEARENGLVLVLDGIEDPHNLGALVRSAYALGAQGAIIPRDRAAGVTPAAVKASAGALSHLPLARVTNLARALGQLKEAGAWVVGADLAGDRLPEQVDLRCPLALVVGSEGAGIRRLVLEQCDFRVRIPMASELGSLNASVAGGILLYEVARQRRAGPARGRAEAPAGRGGQGVLSRGGKGLDTPAGHL